MNKMERDDWPKLKSWLIYLVNGEYETWCWAREDRSDRKDIKIKDSLQNGEHGARYPTKKEVNTEGKKRDSLLKRKREWFDSGRGATEINDNRREDYRAVR